MGIVTLTEKMSNIVKSEPEVDNSRIIKSDYEVAYDQQVEISKYISGYEWEVDYYNAQGDLSDYQDNFDSSIDFGIVDYVEYKNLVLYLDSPLEMTKPEELQGEALIDLNIIPKPADVFIAKLIDGRYGIFTLTSIKRNVYNKSNVFRIGFKIYQIVDSLDDEIVLKIKGSTYTELYYNKDYVKDSSIPVLTKTQLDDITFFNKILEELPEQFNRYFVIPDNYFTPVIKVDTYYYYDQNLINFLKTIMPISKLSSKMEIYEIPKEITILDYMLDESIFLEDVHKYNGYKDIFEEVYNPFMMGIRYSVANRLVKPQKELNEDYLFTPDSVETDMFPMLSSEYYIFSSDFYSVLYKEKTIDEVTLKPFEVSVLNLINREPIDKEVLYDITSELSQLTLTQRYYFIPIVYLLIRYYLNTLKTTTY